MLVETNLILISRDDCRENGVDDVTVQILFCGVCHSDLQTAKNDWGFTTYPVVPGYLLSTATFFPF